MRSKAPELLGDTRDAELSLLGSALRGDPDERRQILESVTEDVFRLPDHKRIWRAIDPDRGLVEIRHLVGAPDVGAILQEACESVPSWANWKKYHGILVAAAAAATAAVKAAEVLESSGYKVIGPSAAPDDEPKRKRFSNTDLGNAERLVARHGTELRFCHPWGKWLVWDSRRWKIDDTAEVFRRASSTVRSIYAEAATYSTEAARNAVVAWASKSEAAERMRALLSLASSRHGIPILPDALDKDPWLLTVQNGTIDLRAGTLREHRRADFLSKLVPIDYSSDASCARWHAFLERVVPSPDVRAFLARAVGWSLSGDTSEHALFFCWGTGRNGKSTFLRIILELAGDAGRQISSDLLLQKKHEEHPTAIAELFGCRVAVSTELPQGRAFDEALVKNLTGGDMIWARRMREDGWNFKPTHHLWIGGNNKPVIRGADIGIWSRIRLIPFVVTIPPKERDRKLLAALRAELPGVLAWAVAGAGDYHRNGLSEPPEVHAAVKEYRDDMDQIGGFLAEKCDLSKRDSRVPVAELFAAYSRWCSEAGEDAVSKKMLTMRLAERGISCSRNTRGRLYRGIRLQPDAAKVVTDDDRFPGSSGSVENAYTADTENLSSSVIPEGENLFPEAPEERRDYTFDPDDVH